MKEQEKIEELKKQKEQLIEYKKMIEQMKPEEKKQRDLYLRDMALGKIQGPPTGYASIDKPWLKYYSEEAITTEIPKETCYSVMKQKANKNPNNIVVEFYGRKITYKEFLENIDEVAKSFKEIGITEGDIITVLPVDTPEIMYTFYALNKLGAIPNMVDVRSNSSLLKDYIDETKSKYVISLDLCNKNVEEAVKDSKVEKVITYSILDSMPLFTKLIAKSKLNIEESTDERFIKWNQLKIIGKNCAEVDEHEYIENYPAAIVHTGGTTGKPKGVLLSNDAFNAVACQVRHTPFNLGDNDKFLNVLVPFVAYGLILGMHSPVVLGWDSILIPSFDPKNMVKLMRKNKPQAVMGIETYFTPLLEDKKYDYSNTKAILTGGMPTKEAFETKMNNKIKEQNGNFEISKGYSMTENSSTATCSYTGINKVGSNGIPLSKTIVSVFNPETHEEMPIGEKGEICITSPQVMLGYYENEDATNEVLIEHEDGVTWLHSGDIGYVDKDGFVYVVDRIKRMIIRSGFKVFPSEIEDVVQKDENIKSCAVIGIDDESDDKAPKAYLVRNNETLRDNDEIVESVRKTITKSSLPIYDMPIEFEFLDELPLTSVGKVDFKKLEEMHKQKVLKK